MPNLVYDTRFFIEHFYSADEEMRERTKREILVNKVKCVSVITLHEVYRLTLQKEGREVAKLRINIISKDFEVIDVDSAVALKAAEIRHGSLLPMADSIIAATSVILKAVCISDDPHFAKLRSVSTRWIE
jgi:predicted nucleic acid-binding protein